MYYKTHLLRLSEQQQRQMVQGPVLPLVGRGLLDPEVLRYVIDSIAAVSVLVAIAGLQDIPLVLRELVPGRLEPVHIFHGLAVPLLQYIDLPYPLQDAVFSGTGVVHMGHPLFLHSVQGSRKGMESSGARTREMGSVQKV